MKEFFQVVDLELALSEALSFSPVATSSIPLGRSVGRVLATDAVAEADLPGFRRSTMDGFAVRASSTFGASDSAPALLYIVGEVEMGRPAKTDVRAGEAVRILTGGMLPQDADAVVMVEHTEAVDATSIEVSRSVAPGANVIEADDDVRRGECVLTAGTRLGGPEIGLLAALGAGEVEVCQRPRVAIISTGDEVVPVTETPTPGQVRDVNSYSLAAMVEKAGGTARRYGIVPDVFETLAAACREALETADVVLLSGGSSVGSRDLTLDVLQSLPDSDVRLHGVAMKPGKPTILADVGGKAFWGLPGHVASAMVVFQKLVRPQLLHLGGANVTRGVRVPARLMRNVASAHGRRDFIRVRLVDEDGGYGAEPVLGRSGLVRTMVQADGLVEIGRDVEGLDDGALVRVELF